MKKHLFNSVSYLSHELQWKETRSTRMADDPPYLTVGTEVSAKYKGAFCEAKIRKVVRVVKCKVTFKSGNGSTLLTDDQIKGTLRIGANVEAKHPDKNQFIEATINKIQDCSQYTVVFDDGDITTLRRSALCLKSGRHFNESETLDQLPLTHPEHFSNPVVGGRRGVRRRAADKDDSSEEEDEEIPAKKDGKKKYEKELDMGKVVCVESTDKKKSKDTWFPALVVSPSAQETVKIRIKDEYLVRSFRDGRYYTVPKKEITEFTKDSRSKYDSNSNVLRSAVEKASLYLDKNELPPHWDREVLFGNARQSESGEGEEQQSESEPEDDPRNEEKDRFIAQLYKFMDDRSTPLNKVPQVCNKDLDLHKLFKIVTGKGGYTKVTNQGQWKSATIKLGYGNMPSTSTINLVKQAYKKFLFNFEEFYRKLGCTWTPRSSVSTSSKSRSSRSIFRERGTPAASSSRETVRDKKDGDDEDGRVTPSPSSTKREAKDKPEKSSSQEEKEKPIISSPDVDSSVGGDTESESSEVKPKPDPPEEIRKSARGRQPKKDRDAEESASPTAASRKKRQATASRDRDRDSSVASSTKDDGSAPPTPSSKEKEPATSTTPPIIKKGLGVGRGKYKRHSSKGATETEEKEEPPTPKEEEVVVEPPVIVPIKPALEIRLGDKLQVYYPKSEGKTYEAKVIDINDKNGSFLVHYTGWNNRYDEWIDRARVSENITLKMEQTGDDGSKSGISSSAGNLTGPGAKAPGVKQRKGRNSTSTTSTTSASSGTTPTPPQPTTPTTTRSGKAAAAAAATLSASPVSGKRRRSTSSEVMPAAPAPKRRRTRQKSGQGGPPAARGGSESEPETSDSDGKSIKSEKTSDMIEHRRTSRKDSVTPTPLTPEKSSSKRGSSASTADEAKSTSKSEKMKASSSAMEIDDDEMSCSSITSTKSKDAGKTPVPATTVVDDNKESSSSSSTSGSGQVIDLDQIRSEMKGLDKIMKGSTTPSVSSVSSPAPPTLSAAVGSSPSSEPSKVDIYEFQEDGADETAPAITSTAPKLKMFSPVARPSSSATPDKTEKNPVIVSASSVEAVAKLGSPQDLPEKVPIVAIEKMEKDKKEEKDKPSKAGSNIRETTESSSESVNTKPPTPSPVSTSLTSTTILMPSVSKETSKLTPPKPHLTAVVTSAPIIISPPVTTTSIPLQITAPILTPASVIMAGGSAPPLTPVVTTMPSSVILSTGNVTMALKGKTVLSSTASPLPTATVIGTTPIPVSVMSASSPSSIPIVSTLPPPPLLLPSSAVAATSSARTTSPAIAATISPASITFSSIATPPPPILQAQHQKPAFTIMGPTSSGMTPVSLSIPERPVLTTIVAASVSKTEPKVVASTTPFRKHDLLPHSIQHSPADPSATASIPTISIVAAKPSTAEIIGESTPPPPPPTSVIAPPQPVQQQPLKIAATIPPPPPVVVKPPQMKPMYGSGPMGSSNTDSPKPKKRKIKIGMPGPMGSSTPTRTLAPLPTVGAPPPPPVVINSGSTVPTTTSVTPTPGRKTPVKKRIPPPMDSPVKPLKPLGMGLAAPPKPGKMNPEAMNAAIASVGATPAPPTIAVPTTVITPITTIFQTHQGSPGVLFATNTASLANQPPPPPVNLLKSNQPVPIKSSSESIAASIAAVASMGSTMSPHKTTTPPTTSSTGKSGMPMKRFMKDDKMSVKDKVFTISTPSPIMHFTHAQPPPPIVVGRTSSVEQPPLSQQQPPPPPLTHQQPPPITIQAKFQPLSHTISTAPGIGSGPPVTFVKAPPGSTPPVHGTPHHILDSSHHHLSPSGLPLPKANLHPKHPVIIIPAAPVVIKPAPFQHQQQPPPHIQPVIVPKPLLMEGQGSSTSQQHSQQPPSVLVTAASSGVVKPMLPITVTPTSSIQQVTSVPPVSIHSLSSITPSSLSLTRGNLPAVELKPVMSISSSNLTADLPPSITVTKATTVMKSISPDIVAASTSYSSMRSSNSSIFTPLKQEDRTNSGKEPEIVVKPAPASAQIVFHTDTKKATMTVEPVPVRHQHQPPPPLVMQPRTEAKEPEENSLLCEEIIPGSPTAGDIEDKMDDDVKELKKEDVSNKSKNESVIPVVERGAATPPSSSGGTTSSVGGSGKPVIVLGPKYGEDVLDDDREAGFMLDDGRMMKFGLDDDEDDNKLMDDRSVDSPMGPPSEGREVDLQFRDSFSEGGDQSQPSSPSTGSTMSSDDSEGEGRHDTRRLSPTQEGGSSKSKDSDDDDMDSDVGSKSTHLDDADSKHGSTRGSTRIRNQASRLGRSPSPPLGKRKRTMRRNKSPEESRYIGRTIRTSSGRKVTPVGRHGSDSYIEKEKEVKQPPPPPPVNLQKPPKTGRYNFIPNLSKSCEFTGLDAEQRIGLISQAINDLKEQYQKTKTEAASFDRRVKRWKRRVREKERLARQEATKAAS